MWTEHAEQLYVLRPLIIVERDREARRYSLVEVGQMHGSYTGRFDDFPYPGKAFCLIQRTAETGIDKLCPVLHRADLFCQLSRTPEREQPAVSFGSSCASPSATAFLRLFRHTAFLLLAAAKVIRLLITVIHFSKSFQEKCSSATFASCDICCSTSVQHSAEYGSSYTVFSSAKFRIWSRITSGG